MMDNNKMICYCDQVTKGEIIELWKGSQNTRRYKKNDRSLL